MKTRFDWVGGIAFLLCLVIVGLLGVAAQNKPDKLFMDADSEGRVTLTQFDVTFLRPSLTQSVSYEVFGEARQLDTEYAFVVLQTVLTPHGRDTQFQTDLRTADGFLYTEISLPDASIAGLDTSPGLALSSTHVFELPKDKVAGSAVEVYPIQPSGLQAIDVVARYQLPELTLQESAIEVAAPVLGPPA